MHHASIRTADIHRAIVFYQQLGFEISEQFTAGITLACWMEGMGGRIELLQVPEPHPAADAFTDEHYTGYYHLSFDLSAQATDLTDWLADLSERFQQVSEAGMGEPLKVLLEPTQQIIGSSVYEVAFIADTDGLPLEFLRMLGSVKAA